MGKKRKPIPLAESSEEEEVEEEIDEEVEEIEEEEEEVEEIEEEIEEEVEEEEEEEHEDATKKETPAAAAAREEEAIDPWDPEAIRKLLEPFGKDQLMELLAEACLKNHALLCRIAGSAASDTSHRKLFVHGLSFDATSESLAAAFSPFGSLEDCNVVVDRSSGRCRGYGFVTFRRRSAARRALAEPNKRVAGRNVSCQLASLGPASHSHNSTAAAAADVATARKLFVNNVPAHTASDRLRAFFEKFGDIEDGPLGADRLTGQFRGFAIFVYRTPEGLRKALEEPKKMFDGCELTCQRAVDGLKQKPAGATAQNKAAGPAAAAVLPASVQPNDLGLTYASQSLMGFNPMAGLVGQGLSTVAVGLLGQNAGAGLLSPGLVQATPLAAPVTPPLSKSTLSMPTLSLPPYGVGLGLGGSAAGLGGSAAGVNSISPSVIGAYGSQAALQGLGVYNSSQVSSTPTSRSQSGLGSISGLMQHYLKR